jgi:cell division topological specificity factor
MNMLQRLFGRSQPTSREMAKDRLQLVVVQDRVKMSPEVMNRMKDDLIQVISKYVEIDEDGINISLTKSGRQSRLTADIPVVSTRHS